MESSVAGHDIDQGWAWVVMAATYLGLMMFSTSFFTVGVIYVELLEYYHDNEVKTSLVGTLNTAIYCILAPFASAVTSRYTCRTSVFIGGLIMAASGLLSSLVDSVDMLILTYGILGGIGNTLVGIPLKVILGYYFEKRRHFVISLGAAVFGAGMFLSTPMALAVFTKYGVKGGFMILGGFNLNMCVIGMICKPSSLEIKIKQQKSTVGSSLSPRASNLFKTYLVKINHLFHFEILTDVTFVLFLFSTFTWNFMLAMCQMHLPNYMVVQGYGPGEITLIMTIFGAFNTIGRFLGAFTVNYSCINSTVLHTILLAISGVLVLTFPLYGKVTWTNYFFAVTIGLLTGGPNGIMTSIGLSILGLQRLAAAHGLEYFFCGLGFGGGPPTASNHSGSYATSFIFAGSTVLLGSVLALLSYIRTYNKKPNFEETTEAQIDLQTEQTKNHTINNGKQPNQNDSLLDSVSGKDDINGLSRGLRPDVDDILILAGSSHSLTI